MSIFVSLVKHNISFYNYHVCALFTWQLIPVIFRLIARVTKKDEFSKQMLENLLRNHKVDQADTLHTCA